MAGVGETVLLGREIESGEIFRRDSRYSSLLEAGLNISLLVRLPYGFIRFRSERDFDGSARERDSEEEGGRRRTGEGVEGRKHSITSEKPRWFDITYDRNT